MTTPVSSDAHTERLLPLADARHWFVQEGLSATQIAARCGLPIAETRARLVDAVLLPPPPLAGALSSETARTDAPNLDPSQQAAAAIAHGPLLLGAGPGTGKTKTLVARCLHLTQAQNVPPENILALTFSNKAAGEMRERLRAAGVGAGTPGPWIGTFHAFGLEVLRTHGAAIGLPPDFTLLDPLGGAALLENNLALLPLEELDNLHNPALHLGALVKAISRAKDEMCDPARYLALAENEMLPQAEQAAAALAAKPKPLQRDKDAVAKLLSDARKARETAHCYAVYQTLLAQMGAADYGDLIYQSVLLLQTHAPTREALQARFPHILADEYQDVNRACALLVRLLAGDKARGLWAVGDHRQSIYRFRGASPANVASFEQDYPGGVRQELAVNYRSAQAIVDCFGAAAAQMGPGQSEAAFGGWRAHRGPNTPGALPPVTFAVAPNEGGQAWGIAQSILALQAEGRPLRDMAVLCAAHRHAEALSAALAQHNIPALYVGSLLYRPEVKDLLAVLALAAHGEDTAFVRAACLPEYGLSITEALALLPRIRAKRTPPAPLVPVGGEAEGNGDPVPLPTFASVLADPGLHEGLAPETAAALTRLAAHLAALASEWHPADALKRYLFDESGFLRHLPLDAGLPHARTQQLLAVYQLLELAQSFALPAAPPADTTLSSAAPPADTELIPAAPPADDEALPASPPPIAAFLAQLRRRQAMGETVRPPLPDAAESVEAVRVLTAHGAKGLEFPVVFVPFLSAGEFPSRASGSAVPEPPGLREAVEGASQDECLFFVALSRARDHLVVSRSETKNGRAIKASPLLECVQAWREAHDVPDTQWPSPPAPAPGEEASAPPPPAELPLHTASALELYQKCPRQYYYARELALSGAPQDAAYPKFHACLHDALTWLQDSRLAGDTPGEPALLAAFDRVWAERGPIGHRHETRYQEAACAMLCTAHARELGTPARLAVPLVAHLANCRVRVSPDGLYDHPDGTLVLTRHRLGKASDDDHRHIRLALMRRAASDSVPSRPARIALRYLQDGTDKDVPPDLPGKRAFEPERLAKYEAAAEGIRLRVFPPAAQGTDACGQCPFALLCPL